MLRGVALLLLSRLHGRGHVTMEIAGDVGMLELDGGVADAELFRQHLPDALADDFAL